MTIIFALAVLSVIIALALASIALTAGKKSLQDREKLTPFECGFDPTKKARAPFSLRFFLVTILFLVFDVEIALLLPLGLLSKYSDPFMATLSAVVLTFVLVLGLIHEWNQGALAWIS
uniref:NADH-ubiquinone oxidoreductase chain 3 n=1 Tax=Gammarus duebeni TaxID=178002 RepID=H9M5R5_9CRUS|nr:NADH dehydrogenase subunit 3 [Gammarus duebeni]AER12194.1 NADH dehydrogenase subunit 3 [Gammarus duebeni]